MKIDLAYFFEMGKTEQVDWSMGEKRALALPIKHLVFTIDCLLQQTDAEWILFWNYSLFGEPDIGLIRELTRKPVDVWHAGLKCGLASQPSIMDFVEPTWMYNKDASPDIEHSSFRLSINACLIRTSVLKKIGSLSASYSSPEMAGIALGYKLLKCGAILRYYPRLLKDSNFLQVQIPERDEWVFLRQFTPKKWQLWAIVNRKGILKNYMQWRATRSISKDDCKPSIHLSEKTEGHAEYEKVSVLVPTLDRYNYLINELEQLSVQTVLPYEVLITDQTDNEKRIKIDTNKYPNLSIKYFPQQEKGQCIAWNKLLEEATGKYVLFLGDDADGIKPDFIERLLQTRKKFDCDMVASHVIELGISYNVPNPYHYIADTFPITLIKKDVLLKTGFMDMFFNKNIRADHDLAMRCHLVGTLMVYDPSAVVYHHRAPSGGLRAHKARVVTNFMSKNSISKFATLTSSEIFLVKKYFTPKQYKNYLKISYFNQLLTRGNIIRKLLRIIFFTINLPKMVNVYNKNKQLALKAIQQKL